MVEFPFSQNADILNWFVLNISNDWAFTHKTKLHLTKLELGWLILPKMHCYYFTLPVKHSLKKINPSQGMGPVQG